MYQELTIVGRLGGDPVKRMAGETPVTSFSVAVNNTYTNREGNKVEEVTWFKVSVWGKPAESAYTYLKKKSMVLVVGVLTPDKTNGNPKVFETRDGGHGASYEVKASTVKFLSPKSEGGSKSSNDEEDEVEETDEDAW